MEFIKADKLPFDPRPQMGEIFTEGFYQWLKYFSKDKGKLSRALTHIFKPEYFFAAVENGEIMAITACTDRKTPPIKLDKKELCQNLGFIGGRITFVLLNKYLVNNPYPFELSPQTGSIEFVATAPKYRGKGAAYGLISHIMETFPYDVYVLEVADNNTAAVRLYEKLGFVTFKQVKAHKRGGFDYFLYMRRSK